MKKKTVMCQSVLMLWVSLLVFNTSCNNTIHGVKSQDVSLSSAASSEDVDDMGRAFYGTLRKLIFEALQSTEYRDDARTVSKNYTTLLKDAIEHDTIAMDYHPISAEIIPVHTFMDYSDPPNFSVRITGESGTTFILSLQKPEDPFSAGSVEIGDRPYSAHIKVNPDIPPAEYEKRADDYCALLTKEGVGEQITKAIIKSDWEIDPSDAAYYAEDYLEILAMSYAYEQITYATVQEVLLVQPEEKMLYKSYAMTSPYAVKIRDAEENEIVIYIGVGGQSRRNFYSVLCNGALITYCISRL